MSAPARFLLAAGAAGALTFGAFACADESTSLRPSAGAKPQLSATDGLPPGVHRQYGTPIKLGDGRARTYAVIDDNAGGRTLELGVALDERALDGLRAPDPARPTHDMDMYDLALPERAAGAFQFVELDWNPKGHGFPHDVAHFDFHFWAASRAERDAIMPDDPAFAEKAAHSPPAADVPPYYVSPATALGLPPVAVAEPMMGIHWVDVRSPELQRFPGGDSTRYQPFTRTFIYGAWDGRFTFMEPMITRAYLLAKRDVAAAATRDEVIPIPTSPAFPAGAFRPDAYRIAYDPVAREYRVALTRAVGGITGGTAAAH